jgi:putative ABC transport system ATP-binding protein
MRTAAEHGHPQVARQTPAVTLANVTKTYTGGVRALDDVSITVERGTFLAVMGPSGSGKSTLMHCAAGLDTPTSGDVSIDGTAIGGLNETRRTELRRERVGFVFQSYNLVPSLSVADNITLPLRLAGTAPDRDWVRLLVERVGLAGRLEHRPAELSGGQQQGPRSPGRSSPGRRSCSATSRPAHWTCVPLVRCSACSATWSTASARRS